MRTNSRVKVAYHDIFRWMSPSLMRTGTANALENQATTNPVTCPGHVRVVYILNNRNGVCTPEKRAKGAAPNNSQTRNKIKYS